MIIEQIIALMAQASGSFAHWIAALSSSASNEVRGLTKASGRLYIAGSADSDDLIGCSVQDAAVLASQFLANIGSYAQTGVAAGLDSSGNSYWLGTTDSVHYPSIDALLIKRNSAGTLQWARAFGDVSSVGALYVDSSGNCYIAGAQSSAALVIKYDSSGNLTWAKSFSNSSAFYAITVSGSAVYCAGEASGTVYLVKLDTDGALTWQRSLDGSGQDRAFGVCVDTDGDVVIAGACGVLGTEGILVAKYTSGGTNSWQRKIITGGSYGISTAGCGYVTPGASGTVYVCGSMSDSGTDAILLAHIADAGTVIWQRKLRPTAGAVGRAIYRDSNGLYVAGNTSSGGDILLAKLPDDGTLTGIYGDYTYGTPTQTDSNPSLTGATPDFTTSTATATSSVTVSISDGTLALARESVA